MTDEFHFGLNKNKVPKFNCERTRYYGYLRRIAQLNRDELEELKIQDEMDFIIEQQELEKRNHSFRTWLNKHKINTNDYNLKDLKTRADKSLFRYTKKDGLYIDSDLIPMMKEEGWINGSIGNQNSVNIILEYFDNNPTHPNYV